MKNPKTSKITPTGTRAPKRVVKAVKTNPRPTPDPIDPGKRKYMFEPTPKGHGGRRSVTKQILGTLTRSAVFALWWIMVSKGEDRYIAAERAAKRHGICLMDAVIIIADAGEGIYEPR